MKLPLLTTALLASIGLTTAAPASGSPSPNEVRQDSKAPPARFGIMAIRSASPIHYRTLEARSRTFWLGGKPETDCPDTVGDACPEGDSTVIAGLRYLDVMVPGGQAIYVAPDGALSFTQAHSAYIPPGSAVTGFSYTPHETEEGRGTYGFNGMGGAGAGGFMACPDSLGAENPDWQVFAAVQNATVPTGDTADCLGFKAMALTYTAPHEDGPVAWQYI